MERFVNIEYRNAVSFKKALGDGAPDLKEPDLLRVIELSELRRIRVDTKLVEYEISQGWFTPEQTEVLRNLDGRDFSYAWELRDELEKGGAAWKLKRSTPEGRQINRGINSRLEYLYKKFWVVK